MTRQLLALIGIITAPVSIPAIALGLWAWELVRPDPEMWRQWSHP